MQQTKFFLVILNVLSSQIGSAWEWYHWIGLEKNINFYRFFIFHFWSWIFNKSSKFWAASCKNESNLLYLFGSRFACSQTAIFSAEPCSKNAGKTSIVLWIIAGEWRIPTSRNPNKNREALWHIFSSNKIAPSNRKTGFHANHDLNKQEVGFILAWSGSELLSLFK